MPDHRRPGPADRKPRVNPAPQYPRIRYTPPPTPSARRQATATAGLTPRPVPPAAAPRG
jgi:hypothetical protein